MAALRASDYTLFLEEPEAANSYRLMNYFETVTDHSPLIIDHSAFVIRHSQIPTHSLKFPESSRLTSRLISARVTGRPSKASSL